MQKLRILGLGWFLFSASISFGGEVDILAIRLAHKICELHAHLLLERQMALRCLEVSSERSKIIDGIHQSLVRSFPLLLQSTSGRAFFYRIYLEQKEIQCGPSERRAKIFLLSRETWSLIHEYQDRKRRNSLDHLIDEMSDLSLGEALPSEISVAGNEDMNQLAVLMERLGFEARE